MNLQAIINSNDSLPLWNGWNVLLGGARRTNACLRLSLSISNHFHSNETLLFVQSWVCLSLSDQKWSMICQIVFVCMHFFNYLPWNHYWTSNPIVMPVIVSTEILQLAWLAGGRPFEVSVDVQLANNPLILKASSICYLKRAENSVVVTKFLCGHFVCGTYTFRGNNFEWSQAPRKLHN